MNTKTKAKPKIITVQGYSKRNRNKTMYRIEGDKNGNREWLTRKAAERAIAKAEGGNPNDRQTR